MRRSTRERKPPQKYVTSFNYLLLSDFSEPESYDEAMRHTFKEEWEKSVEEEMDALHHQNRTWDLVKLPKGKRVLKNKWM